jgi:hypothetical protein
VRVRYVGGLTTVKLPEHRQWLDENARRFEQKWGWLPPPVARYRRADSGRYVALLPELLAMAHGRLRGTTRAASPAAAPHAVECEECRSLRDRNACAFY